MWCVPEEAELGEVVEVRPTEGDEVVGGEVVGDGDDEEDGGAGARACEGGGGGREAAEEVGNAVDLVRGEARARFWAVCGGGGVGEVVDGVNLEDVHFFIFCVFLSVG